MTNTLIATNWPRVTWRAESTTPMPPEPNTPSTRYLSATTSPGPGTPSGTSARSGLLWERSITTGSSLWQSLLRAVLPTHKQSSKPRDSNHDSRRFLRGGRKQGLPLDSRSMRAVFLVAICAVACGGRTLASDPSFEDPEGGGSGGATAGSNTG